MYTLSIANSFGQRVELSNNELNYQILSVGGLNPPKIQVNRATVGILDGTRYNSSRIEERNVVISVKINGDIESNRLALYDLFKLKKECTIYYKNDSRDVFIKGYVEGMECDYFTKSERMQISVVCPSPFFKDIDYIITDISKVLRKFHFPFSIDYNNPIPFSEIDIERVVNVKNEGDVECGLIINIEFKGDVNKVKVLNVSSGNTFTVNHAFIEGDKLVINTNKGEKSITLNRGGVLSNLFPKVERDSTFFTLFQGDNFFSYLADDGTHDNLVTIQYSYNKLYVGV